jgi:hypothetical protein
MDPNDARPAVQPAGTTPTSTMNWLPLVALGLAQFVMVLDQTARNLSISALVDDHETARLRSLKAGLLGAALLTLTCLAFTADLPHRAARRDPEAAAASSDGLR